MTLRGRVSARRVAAFCLALLTASSLASAQGTFTLRFVGQDGGGGFDTLLYGRDPRGTYCIDPVPFYEGTRSFTEFELPPSPPAGVFDVRWFNHRDGLGGCISGNERGNGLRYDIRPATGVTQVDTFRVKYQQGSAGPITLTWQSGLDFFCDSMRLKDLFGGFLVNADMFAATSQVVTNPALTQVNIIMYGAKAASLVSPPNGGTVSSTVTLSWNAVPNATRYRVQVATDSSFTPGSIVLHDSTLTGTSRQVTGVSGMRYWRVAAGQTRGWTAYSPVWSFATGEPPPAPTLQSPPNGATGQTVTPTLSWTIAGGGFTYRVQVGTDSTFASGIAFDDSTVTGTSRQVANLSGGTLYHWRVTARNAGGYGPSSAVWSFTTVAAPAAPLLSSPANGSVDVPLSPTLSWGSVSGAAFYRLQVATDSTFTSGVVFNDSTITGTSRQVGPLSGSTRFYWRVRARGDGGNSPFSSVWRFTTIVQAPPAPALSSPPDNAQAQPVTLTLSWTIAGSGYTYRVQVGTNPNFTTGVVLDDSTVTATSRQVGPLANNTLHYWRVTAKNAAGYGPSSATWSFTTVIALPAAPALVSPANGAQNIPLNPMLTWNAAPSATSYRLQVATDSAFTQRFFDDSTLAGTQQQISPLAANTTYFWRVRGKNAAGSGPYSTMFRFLTTAAPPIPALVLPPDSATRLERQVRFSWRTVPGASAYHLQVGTSGAFTTLVYNDSTIADSTRTAGPFPYAARLHWRIRSRNTAGASEFSAPRVFTVMLQPPAPVTPVAPSANAANQPVVSAFRWLGSTMASWYNLQVALDTLMTNLFLNDSAVTDTQRAVRLAPNGIYYWRTAGVNTEGTYGAFSGVRRMSVGNFAPATPLPFHPANGDTNVSRTPTLRWVESPGALHYRVQVALDNLFNQVVVDDSSSTENWFEPGLLQANRKHYWRVRAKGSAGYSPYSVIQNFTTGSLIVAVGERPDLEPGTFVLHQNYPNPFNPSTTFRYELWEETDVTIRVYNSLGQEVAELASGVHTRGSYTARWNAAGLPSGVYIVRMTAGGTTAVRKALFVK
ncbi:MAG: T9SS type A sorting domain-containing protein [Bacteroidota bacterium]